MEANFIFDGVVNLLRFVEALEAEHFSAFGNVRWFAPGLQRPLRPDAPYAGSQDGRGRSGLTFFALSHEWRTC